MATTKTTKQKTTSLTFRPRQLIKLGAALLLTFAVLLQLRFDWNVYYWSRAGQNVNAVTNLIIQAMQGINKPAVVEPVSKKVYLPDASLVLPPPPQDLGQSLLYVYLSSSDGSDAGANVTLSNAVNSEIAKLESLQQSSNAWNTRPSPAFDEVPRAQACVRGVHLVFGNKLKYDNLVFTKQLADGRTMHIYTEATKCPYNLDPLANYLKQAQSY
jgi:hypothetical protein